MTDWFSPVDRARMGNNNDVVSNVQTLRTQMQQVLGQTAQAQNLGELSNDVWALNTSFPSICQGRLTLVSGNPTPNSRANINGFYFTPYIGNLIGMYNGSTWDQIVFNELSILVQQSQTGNTHNGTAVVDGLTDTSQLVVGMWVSGTGIPATAAIQSVDSATQITMTVNSTASASVSVSFKVPTSTDIDIFIVNTGNGALALRMLFWNARSGGTISNVTNASPMVVTSSFTPPTGNNITVNIRNVVGATGANGTWRVGTVGAGTYTLLNLDGSNSSAGGAYTSGGSDQYADQTGITRASALTLQDGVYVLSSDHTWRYLGSAHVSNTGLINDSLLSRCLWNYYNRIQRPMEFNDGGSVYNSGTINTWIPGHNNTSHRLEFMMGQIENGISASKRVGCSTGSSGIGQSGVAFCGAGTSGPTYFTRTQNANASLVAVPLVSSLGNTDFYLTLNPGYFYLQDMEFASSTTNVAWRPLNEYLLEGLVWA